jgi:hypothetical protein
MAKATADGRIRDIETALWGAERNGDDRSGFIAETRDCMEVIRVGLETANGRVARVEQSVVKLVSKWSGWRAVLRASIPPLIAGGFSALIVILSRGAT